MRRLQSQTNRDESEAAKESKFRQSSSIKTILSSSTESKSADHARSIAPVDQFKKTGVVLSIATVLISDCDQVPDSKVRVVQHNFGWATIGNVGKICRFQQRGCVVFPYVKTANQKKSAP